ncbi:CBS domain-containing protein [Sphaerisporangium sp. B11E5]|uniref:CBS domain-containing protein n=1 Tax=Sphaerisporangium sp. B11E5 TaxID=3153563 RepID=UPI00325F3DE2
MTTFTAADVMSRDVVTVTPEESPLMAWELMRRAEVHHIPVIGEDQRLYGILTLETLAMEWQGSPGDMARRQVRDLLPYGRLPRVLCQDPLDVVAAAMLDARLDAVPVVDEHGRVAGLVTSVDVLRAVAGRVTPTAVESDVHPVLFRLQPVLPLPLTPTERA